MPTDINRSSATIKTPSSVELFRTIDGTELEALLRTRVASTSEEIRSLTQSFDSLVRDRYVPPRFGIRRRRFGRFRCEFVHRRLVPIPGTTFLQRKSVNQIFGGIKREFAPLEDHVRDSPLLHETIRFLLKIVDRGEVDWLINVHQFRVETMGRASCPAPEGIHRDGHDFVAIVAVNRFNVDGGVSRIYDGQRELVTETVLRQRFDTLLVNDRTAFHGVTPIRPATEGFGFRDVLVMDFNRGRSGQ